MCIWVWSAESTGAQIIFQNHTYATNSWKYWSAEKPWLYGIGLYQCYILNIVTMRPMQVRDRVHEHEKQNKARQELRQRKSLSGGIQDGNHQPCQISHSTGSFHSSPMTITYISLMEYPCEFRCLVTGLSLVWMSSELFILSFRAFSVSPMHLRPHFLCIEWLCASIVVVVMRIRPVLHPPQPYSVSKSLVWSVLEGFGDNKLRRMVCRKLSW